VNPLSRGVTATPKKTAIHEAVRRAQGLKNGYKSITVPGHPRQLLAQKELVSSNPIEGALRRLEERSLPLRINPYGISAGGQRGRRGV